MDPSALFRQLSRETAILRDAQGRWFHEGEPLRHPGLIRAFDSWIDLAEDGRFCLRNGVDWAYVTLEGPALFVRSLRVGAEGEILLDLSDGRRQRLDPSTLRQGPDQALYCDVREGRLSARFDRHAMAQLSEVLEEDGEGVYIRIEGRRVRPPEVDDPLEYRAGPQGKGEGRND